MGCAALKALCSSDKLLLQKCTCSPIPLQPACNVFKVKRQPQPSQIKLLLALRALAALLQPTPATVNSTGSLQLQEQTNHGGSELQVLSPHTLGTGGIPVPSFRQCGVSRLKPRLFIHFIVFSISISKHLQCSLRRNLVPRKGF